MSLREVREWQESRLRRENVDKSEANKRRKKPEEGRLSQVRKEEGQVALQLKLWPLPVFLLPYILLDQV